MNRREMIGAVGVAAGAAALGLPLPRPVGRAAGLVGGGWPQCVATPAQTEGPYFVDEQLERSDVRVDPVDGAVKEGVPLRLRMTVHRVDGTACAPLTGVHVDVWQCDARGLYAGVRDAQGLFDTRGKKFLRGYQVTDAGGAVEFRTIYPGWYSGRTPHIHFKTRLFAGSRRTYEFTSQLYFDDDVTDRVHARAPYDANGPRTTRNARDGLFRRGRGEQLVLRLAEDTEGWLGTFDVGLRMT